MWLITLYLSISANFLLIDSVIWKSPIYNYEVFLNFLSFFMSFETLLLDEYLFCISILLLLLSFSLYHNEFSCLYPVLWIVLKSNCSHINTVTTIYFHCFIFSMYLYLNWIYIERTCIYPLHFFSNLIISAYLLLASWWLSG